MNQIKSKKEHRDPVHTANVIISFDSKVLFVIRKNEPYKGTFVIPGGKINEGERVEDAAVREVKEETSIDIELENILGVYSDPKRDPREHRISTVFIGKISEHTDRKVSKEGENDATGIKWIDLKDLDDVNFGFDHRKIIEDYKKWRQTQRTFWSSKDTNADHVAR
jgi:ADP-ribose pyrophosphatase YjhB (NUDIX family)